MAGGIETQPIRIPLQAVVTNVNEARNVLKEMQEGLKPDSKVYKDTEKLLEQIRKKIESIQDANNKGFINKNEMQKAGREMGKILESLHAQIREVQNANFSDLIISDDDSISTQVKSFESVIQTLKNLQNEIDSINSKKVKLDIERKHDAEKNRSVTEREDKVLSIFSGGDISDKSFFNKAGRWTQGPKVGSGKENMRALLEQVGIDKDTIDEVLAESAANLKNLSSKIEAQIKAIREKRQAPYDKREEKLDDELAVASEQFKQLQESLQDSSGNYLPGFEALGGVLSDLPNIIKVVVQAFEQYKGEVSNSSEVSNQANEAFGSLKRGANQLEQGLHQASEEFERFQKFKNITNNLKNMISRWMGFYEVINLVKRGISSIITDIRNLDKVMTEIAVVTNMTQSNLWGQMNQYQSIAKEYAVSTEGVYKVSQLYYQQGGPNI